MEFVKKLRMAKNQLTNTLAQVQQHHNPEKTITPGMPELLRKAAAEGAVLLENRVLPLAKGTKVSVFGRVQIDWFCTGYGSGGDVNAPYRVNLLEGLRNCDDLEVNEDLAQIYEDWVEDNLADQGFLGQMAPLSPGDVYNRGNGSGGQRAV